MNNVAESSQTREEMHERINKIDFKMVTFSLGGRDYGVDILKIKEIAKFASYTYVPNSPPFVKGVYNLRGDIISIIDFRILFHLTVEENRETYENGLILRLEDNILGVVVDSIDKVVGISSEDIQPPHPIFGDINIKYLSGVVENDGRLYIILNVDKIFAKEEASRPGEPRTELRQEAPVVEENFEIVEGVEPEKDFVAETLATFRSFYLTDSNTDWFEKRYAEWKKVRGGRGADLQLKSAEEADEFLEPFYSPDTGRFWDSGNAESYSDLLPDVTGKIVQVWNPGCGKGFEAYSFTAVLCSRYSGNIVKIRANDNDLLFISTAPNLIFTESDLPDYLRPHTVQGKNGWSFQSVFKDKILFEYHDVLHPSVLPELDFILARDLISFLKPEDQRKILEEFHERLKPGGMIFLGVNENAPDSSLWEKIEINGRAAFKKIIE